MAKKYTIPENCRVHIAELASKRDWAEYRLYRACLKLTSIEGLPRLNEIAENAEEKFRYAAMKAIGYTPEKHDGPKWTGVVVSPDFTEVWIG